MKLIVTTAQSGKDRPEAEKWAIRLNCPLVARDDLNLPQLLQRYQAEAVLVAAAHRVSCFAGRELKEFFFHPSLAQLRIKELERGGSDNLVRYLGLAGGEQILDCTLGLAADALTMAWAVGEQGQVTGLESSPIIAALVEDGLSKLTGKLAVPASRILVINSDCRGFLRQVPANSYDIVYFDPMFRQKIKNSSAMDAMRPLTNPAALEQETLLEARRVCRKLVAVKERKGGLEPLNPPRVAGSRQAEVVFGIWEKEG